MTYERFLETLGQGGDPPEGITPELSALWFAKAGRWDEAHDIAQEIPSKMGSWIHGLLHAMEGDFPNSGYWYRRAGEQPIAEGQIPGEWERLVQTNLRT